MNEKQLRLYRALWGGVRKVLRARGMAPGDCDAMRHKLHVEALGYDKSSTKFSRDEFTAVKTKFLALIEEPDLDRQMVADRTQEDRWMMNINRLCVVLQVGREYVDKIVRTMHREGRIGQPWRMECETHNGKRVGDYRELAEDGRIKRREIVLEELPPKELMKVFVAMKKQARRRWPTKADLLAEIFGFVVDKEIEEEAAIEAANRALGFEEESPQARTRIRNIDQLNYEELLRVFEALLNLVVK